MARAAAQFLNPDAVIAMQLNGLGQPGQGLQDRGIQNYTLRRQVIPRGSVYVFLEVPDATFFLPACTATVTLAHRVGKLPTKPWN